MSEPLPDSFCVRDMGSFHVGGQIVTLTGLPPRHRVSTQGGPSRPIEQNGEMAVGQMYVQYVRLAAPRSPVPVLMWHGGGMTGANWEATPDGRAGWQSIFLRAGFDVFVSDAVERGRAGFAPSPQVYPEDPFFRTAEEAWEEVFRFGPHGSYHRDPAVRGDYPGCRFPLRDFDAFMKGCVPRWGCNDALTQAAYDAQVARLEASVLLMHSQGGNFGFHAALHAPDRVKAVIALEPSGAPDPSREDAARLAHIPHLFIWGDHLDGSVFWTQYRPNVERWAEALGKAGASVDWIDLPAHGIRGNSHALMLDDNSDEIARMAIDWLAGHGLRA